MYLVFLFCTIISSCSCVKIPSSLQKCSKNDKNFDQCLKLTIEDGLSKSKNLFKEIGLPVMDPLMIPTLTVEPGNDVVKFTQKYTNFQIRGISDTKCDNVKMDFNNHTFLLDCYIPKVNVSFEYDFNGRFLILPIDGKGTGKFDIEQLKIYTTYSLQEYYKEGKKHYKISDTKTLLKPKFMNIKLKNLFQGDKLLGDTINQLLNNYWFIGFQDVCSKYEEAFAQVAQRLFSQILTRVSAAELWDDV